MNDSKVLLVIQTVPYILRFHYPFPCLIMNHLTNWYKPVHQGTWVVQPLIDKREEKVDPPNAHAYEFIVLWVSHDKDGVTTRVLILPQQGQANVSVIHATCSTEVTQGIEPCNSRVVNKDMAIELWMATEWDNHGVEISIQIQLLKEEPPYQCG